MPRHTKSEVVQKRKQKPHRREDSGIPEQKKGTTKPERNISKENHA